LHLNDLEGPILVAPSPTPFNGNQQVNLDAIKSNASKWLETELSGFVLGTENGEEQLLSIEERLSIVESVSEVAKNKKLIIGGVDNPSIKNTLLESEALVSAGVDILRIRIPRRRDTIDKYFDEILPKIPAPALIIHQMAPGGFANSMTLEGASPEQIGRFCSHDNVEGYISSHLVRFEMMARKFVPQQKHFWLPNAMLMVAQIVEGANGGCFMFGNIAPQVCRKIMSLALENKIDEAKKLNDQIVQADWDILGQGAAGLKYAMDILGFYGGIPRSPLRDLNEDEKNKIKKSLTNANIFKVN
jgi:4-hydroxy-2-oxoglutarate aldolase